MDLINPTTSKFCPVLRTMLSGMCPAYFTLLTKKLFDKEIENDAIVGSPTVKVTRMMEENDVVVAEGSVKTKKKEGEILHLVFCDVFEMQGGKIKKLIGYIAVQKQSSSLMEASCHSFLHSFHFDFDDSNKSITVGCSIA